MQRNQYGIFGPVIAALALLIAFFLGAIWGINAMYRAMTTPALASCSSGGQIAATSTTAR